MRFLPLELKSADPDAGTFTGYGAVFGNVDQGGDLIHPGAFKGAPGQVPLLWSHDLKTPIGIARVAEDATGLAVKGRLVLEDPQAQVARAHLKAGSVRGLSIGYGILPNGSEFKGGVRHLKRLKLHEISLTAVPMNELATVHAVKAMECKSIAELEQLLRDALTLSGRKARKLASAAWPILTGSDEPDAVDLIQQFEALTK